MQVATAAPLTLRSTYHGRRRFSLELRITDSADTPFSALVPPGSRLALTCTCILTPTAESGARVVDREAGYLVLAAESDEPFDDRWTIDPLHAVIPARHANDGPESAYIIRPDGQTTEVSVEPTALDAAAERRASPPPARPPQARSVSTTARPIVIADIAGEFESTVGAVTALLGRTGRSGRLLLGESTNARGPRLGVIRDDRIATAGYAVEADGDTLRLRIADVDGMRHGLLDLVRAAERGAELTESTTAPRFAFRGVHIDLARQWYEPDVVLRLLDIAAWRRLNRVHLHLTDDEAWRLPVDEYPQLAEVGGRRGHGLPIPPLNGSSAAPYGRGYTTIEIASWVQRADELGIELVPEIDVPGHCHAALQAMPGLRDPHDRSHAPSVQGFVDNVLVPGRPATHRFLEATFGAVANAFPTSPVLHLGGDEVAAEAWRHSPSAHHYAAARGLHGAAAIARAIHDDVVNLIRSIGRAPAMWEEAAVAGVDTTGGYAVGWTSSASTAALAAAGHDVVVAAGEAYYLDMATAREWRQPGACWAGVTSIDDSWRFDPLAGVEPDHHARVIGTQACIWSEHITDLDVLDELVFPRLDLIAERGWGRQDDLDAAAVAAEWRDTPRFTSDR
ncbi:MAG: family 20 glycosylhydrolase [Actinomycetota bacterium]